MKRVPVKVAASLMNVSEQFVRAGLRHNRLPFGGAVKMSSVWTYYINPALFAKYIGKTVDEIEILCG